MSQRVLSQAEIDALFNRYSEKPLPEDFSHLLSPEQLDTIGEVGNICMGTAATTLSQLLGQQVIIGNPQVIVCQQEEVFKSFETPYLLVYLSFKTGISGFNILIITEEEVALIANLMMGGDGIITDTIKLSEMEISAAEEAMNQMIGSACTAMTDMFGVTIDITPPQVTMVHDLAKADLNPLPTEEPVVVARFETTIGELIKTTIMQITSVDAVRDQANYLLMQAGYIEEPPVVTAAQPEKSIAGLTDEFPKDMGIDIEGLPNMAAALALPTQLTLTLGKISTTVEELAKLQIGSKINLPFTDGSVDIYAGDILVGRGKIVHNSGTPRLEITQLYMPR